MHLQTRLRFLKPLATYRSPRPYITHRFKATATTMATEGKDPSRVVAGLKASVHNPRVSEEAKGRAVERLEEMGASPETPISRRSMSQESIPAMKRTLEDQFASEQDKAHAREILMAAGYTIQRVEGMSEDEHMKRVMAGYKAAMHNPRVSPEAKQHAKQFLGAHGADVE